MKYDEISKIDAAIRQLQVAIRIFFERKDPLAVHTLAAASQQLFLDLGKIRDIKSLYLNSELIRLEKRSEVYEKFREAQNFLKHADRDPEASLKFNREINSIVLFDACHLCENVTGKHFTEIPEIHVFVGWFYMKYPDLLIEGAFKDEFVKLLEGIDTDDFEIVISAIEDFRENRFKAVELIQREKFFEPDR